LAKKGIEMAQVKLTKTELRVQQIRLAQLRKYLPTLQLKKSMLQAEINQLQGEIDLLKQSLQSEDSRVQEYSALFSERNSSILLKAVSVKEVLVTHENIAGVEIPIFQEVVFIDPKYSLFDTPIWYESAIDGVKKLLILQEKIKVEEKKKEALAKELREVSIRVNLFEKIMIPRATENIKRIKIFLGDQQLAAVSQAKVSKKKILMRSQMEESV
jgi:V/A-type H+-transporting ATPase subunit D